MNCNSEFQINRICNPTKVEVNGQRFLGMVNLIERVFERGDVEDIRNCRCYYGDGNVSDVLLNTKFLPETRMYLASAVIDKPVTEFRCYKLRQSNPELFPY